MAVDVEVAMALLFILTPFSHSSLGPCEDIQAPQGLYMAVPLEKSCVPIRASNGSRVTVVLKVCTEGGRSATL